MVYVSLGGAHADILTDGVQGFLMLLIGVLVILLFLFGAGLDGGFGTVISNIRGQDPNQVGWINRSTPLYHSWWSQLAVLLAHIPLGLLPHIGNKIWALKTGKSRFTFLRFASVFGVTLGMLGLGGAPGAGGARRPAVRRGLDPERGAAGAVHRALPGLAGRAHRRRHPGGGHVDGGRTRRVLVADRRERSLPADDRAAFPLAPERRAARPPGAGHQPLGDGRA